MMAVHKRLRLFGVLGLGLLVTLGSTLTLRGASNASSLQVPTSQAPSSTWNAYEIPHKVSFSAPANFVRVSDGSPFTEQSGAALLNKQSTNVELLFGIIIDEHPGLSVAKEISQLKHLYAKDPYQEATSTQYGRQLTFSMPDGATYAVYVSKMGRYIREIVVNKVHDKPGYAQIIRTFLHSVRDLS